ncbi:MAG: hypothetical protein DDT19_00086 [Syntrophomonadaceae bacterium]|nr:hypothetical protein [Bacillota bacterium]
MGLREPRKARHFCRHQNWLFAANTPEHPNRLWFSSDEGETWDAHNWIGTGASAITGLDSRKEGLAIATDGNHWLLGGSGPEDFYLTCLRRER